MNSRPLLVVGFAVDVSKLGCVGFPAEDGLISEVLKGQKIRRYVDSTSGTRSQRGYLLVIF